MKDPDAHKSESEEQLGFNKGCVGIRNQKANRGQSTEKSSRGEIQKHSRREHKPESVPGCQKYI